MEIILSNMAIIAMAISALVGSLAFTVSIALSKYAKQKTDAEKLKRKILLHGRTFNDRGDKKVSLYFYEEEASTLILLTSIYVLAFGNPTNDYYEQIGLTRKGVGSSHDAEQDHSQT